MKRPKCPCSEEDKVTVRRTEIGHLAVRICCPCGKAWISCKVPEESGLYAKYAALLKTDTA
mgnify:CR=1 FL=1